MKHRSRRRWIASALAGAAVLALLLVRQSTSIGTASTPAVTADPAVPLRAAEVQHEPAPEAAADPAQVTGSTQPRARDTAVPNLARQTADDYRRRARFPRSSQPLSDDAPDPIVSDREVTPVASRGRNGEEPTLSLFPAQSGFESPESAVLYAHLSVRGNRVPAKEIRGTVTTEGLRPIGEVEYRDDGDGGDEVAGDRIYTAVFLPPPGASEDLAASYLVQVRAVTFSDDERLGAGSFLYSTPHAELTGKYRESIVEGSLVIEAQIDVVETGRFHIEGTLYSRDGSRKLLWAQSAAELSPGTHWIALPFYGLGLREAGVDGPYLLRYVALSTTIAMPNAKNRLVENAFVTTRHRAADFTAQPYGDPTLLDAADRLERDGGPGRLEAGG